MSFDYRQTVTLRQDGPSVIEILSGADGDEVRQLLRLGLQLAALRPSPYLAFIGDLGDTERATYQQLSNDYLKLYLKLKRKYEPRRTPQLP